MSCGCEAYVERDELERVRPSVGGYKRGGELKRIGCTKIVHADGTASYISDVWRWVDFLPAPTEVS